jgi:NAD(P)H dehydrogenase (quinone)
MTSNKIQVKHHELDDIGSIVECMVDKFLTQLSALSYLCSVLRNPEKIMPMPPDIFWNGITRYVARKLNSLTSHVPPPPRYAHDDDDDASADSSSRKILLVHVHPMSDSYSNAIANAVVSGAEEGGHELRYRNLYDEEFRPQLNDVERRSYFDGSVDSYHRDDRLSSDIRGHISDLRWANSVIFVYPTWWFNVPAMLKGYFDRVFVMGETWDFPGRRERDAIDDGAKNMIATKTATTAIVGNVGLVPKLTNIHRVMGISTYGASRAVTFASGDGGRNTICTAIRHGNFNPICPCYWLGLYDLDHCDLNRRKEFLDEVRRVVRDEF